MYAVPHLFSLATATTARQFGMGGVATTVEDIGFANPAFAGTLSQSQAGLRHSSTQFGEGLKLRGTHAWYSLPLGMEEGMQLVGLRLDSNRGGLTAPGLEIETEESDVAVHYGRRLADRWMLGVGVAPILETTTRLFDPAGNEVASWDSKADWGLRVGVLHRHDHDGYAGLVFDYYRESVCFRPPLPGASTESLRFNSTTFGIGASGRVGEGLLGAIEWMQLRSASGDHRTDAEGLHLGLEYEFERGLHMRAGSRAGAMTLGAGYSRDDWVVNYAFIDGWNDNEVGELLGGSDTHQLEVGRYW